MDPLTLSSIFEIGKTILGRVFPDPAARAAAELELFKAQQEGAFREMDAELQRSLAQTNINAVEAANTNLFVQTVHPFPRDHRRLGGSRVGAGTRRRHPGRGS